MRRFASAFRLSVRDPAQEGSESEEIMKRTITYAKHLAVAMFGAANSLDQANRLISPLAALLLFSAAVSPLAAQPAIGQTVTIPGHVIPALANATRLPHTPQIDQDQITVTVVLN